MKQKPEKLPVFMYAVIKEASSLDLIEFLENWEISEDEYEDIRNWFHEELGIDFYSQKYTEDK